MSGGWPQYISLHGWLFIACGSFMHVQRFAVTVVGRRRDLSTRAEKESYPYVMSDAAVLSIDGAS